MSNVRSALKTTLEALSLNGATRTVFDYGSDAETIANIEQAAFDTVAMFIGDEVTTSDPHSHAYRVARTEFSVHLAAKTASDALEFGEYVYDLAEGLSLSRLGLGDVLSVEVDGGENIQRPITAIWMKEITVTVVHLMEVNITVSEFVVNANRPSCSIDSATVEAWCAAGGGTFLNFDVASIAPGTGTITKLHVLYLDSIGGAGVSSTTLAGNETSVSLEMGFFDPGTSATVTVTAILLDSLGMYWVDTVTATVA